MLTATDMLFFFPCYLASNASIIKGAITQPYGSWSSVHAGFSQVPQYPAQVMEAEGNSKMNLIASRLVCPVSAYIFFAMFGLGEEARRGYKQAFCRILTVCKLRKESKQSPPE